MFWSSKKDDTTAVVQEEEIVTTESAENASEVVDSSVSDDLLIISDEEENTSSVDTIDFSFDSEAKEETAISKKVSEPETLVVEEESQKASQEAEGEVNIDLGMNLTQEEAEETEAKKEAAFTLNLDTSVAEEPKETETTTETTAEINLMDLSTSDDSSTASWDDTSSGDSSMNDILAGTIAKLEARKWIIAKERETKKAHEAEIKDQIKALEEEHTNIEADLSTLNIEDKKIDSNIVELEKMKSDPVKEHNERRVAKK